MSIRYLLMLISLGSIHTESLGPFKRLSRGKKVYRFNVRMIYGGSGHADGVTLLQNVSEPRDA